MKKAAGERLEHNCIREDKSLQLSVQACVCVCRCMSDFRCTSLQASSQANMNFQEEEKMFVCMRFGFNEHVGEAVRAEKQM